MTITRLDFIALTYKFQLMCYFTDELPFESIRLQKNSGTVDINRDQADELWIKNVNLIPRGLLKACIAFAETPCDERGYQRYNSSEVMKRFKKRKELLHENRPK